MTAVIICNGTIRDYNYYKKYLDEADLIICADGGASHARRFGIRPHILLGDFDSIRKEDLEYLHQQGVEIRQFPVEKDMTDTELAVEVAAEKGCNTVIIIGGLGTRLDHSISNVFLLKKMLDRGIQGVVADEYNEITLINDHILLHKEPGIKITLLPLAENAEGVTTKGLYYPLDHATLPVGSTWGVSNEFASDTAEVTLEKGLLLVMRSRDN